MGETDWGGKLGLVLMVGAMLIKSLIQFSVEGWAVFPSCCLSWGQTMVEVMKIMATFFKRSHVHSVALGASDPAASHCRLTPPLETPGHSWACLGQFLVGSLLLSPGSWYAQGFVCAVQESVSSVLCKFWSFYREVNGNLLQGCLCHTQVCCTQSPCHCNSPLLTSTRHETLKHTSVSVSVGSLGPGAHEVCLSPLSVSGRYGVWF